MQPDLRKIAEIVLAANAAGRAAGRPGVPCANVDKAARHVIEQAGYGEYFTHRTGHGIGMEDHEEPYMRGDNMQMLYPGMAYTVEPGIYLPGRGGCADRRQCCGDQRGRRRSKRYAPRITDDRLRLGLQAGSSFLDGPAEHDDIHSELSRTA